MDNTFTSIGAVAAMFDASCYINDETSIPRAFHIWNATVGAGISRNPDDLGKIYRGENLFVEQFGHHFFQNVTVNGTVLDSPSWDFTESQKNKDALVHTKKFQTLAAPRDPDFNVALLQVAGFQGGLAVRLSTRVVRATPG
jgi:hypothetical protein